MCILCQRHRISYGILKFRKIFFLILKNSRFCSVNDMEAFFIYGKNDTSRELLKQQVRFNFSNSKDRLESIYKHCEYQKESM